jgi:hypothetical protein
MTKYDDEELLMLSGIQHIAFCERQWAENVRTIEGNHLHERVDDPFEKDWKKVGGFWVGLDHRESHPAWIEKISKKRTVSKCPKLFC